MPQKGPAEDLKRDHYDEPLRCCRITISRCYEVIGMSKTCTTIRELRQKVAEHYGKEPVQLTLYLPKGKEAN